jgi:hypothetical protein
MLNIQYVLEVPTAQEDCTFKFNHIERISLEKSTNRALGVTHMLLSHLSFADSRSANIIVHFLTT